MHISAIGAALIFTLFMRVESLDRLIDLTDSTLFSHGNEYTTGEAY